jgi:heme exporter protein CcmD
MIEYLAFGKYGWFVWSSIGLFVVVVGGLTVQTLMDAASARRALARLEAKDRDGA